VISGRGLYVAHHAPPFRLSRRRVPEALTDPTPFKWWRPAGDRPERVGPFSEVVLGSVMESLVWTATTATPPVPEPGEVVVEFANFEHVAIGNGVDGWIVCFERDLAGAPVLVGLMRRGVTNPASIVLERV
jgi:hypothetical protein